MSDGTKLAVAILVIWVALVFFFFAFHPNGVTGVKNPGDMLKWLMAEFQNIAGGNATAAADTSGTGPPANATQTSDVGTTRNTGGAGVQVA